MHLPQGVSVNCICISITTTTRTTTMTTTKIKCYENKINKRKQRATKIEPKKKS